MSIIAGSQIRRGKAIVNFQTCETKGKRKHTSLWSGRFVSDIHIAGKFRDDKYGKTLSEKKAKTLQMAVEAVTYAKNHTDSSTS